MTTPGTAGLALALAATLPAGVADVGTLATSREGTAHRVDAWLPGRVQDAVVMRDERGPALWLFVVAAPPTPVDPSPEPAATGPCDEARTPHYGELWRFDPDAAGGGSLERVLTNLPSGPTRVGAFDIGDDGTQALIAVTREGLVRWPTTPAATPPLLTPGLPLDPRTAFLVAFPGTRDPLLAASKLGEAAFGRLRNGVHQPLRTVELPVQAVYRHNEFRLTTRPVIPVGTDDGVPAYADMPEPAGPQRLHGRLVRPTTGEATAVEWWARLPEPEELLELRYLSIGGQPALFVTTRPAHKLALFGEKRLRLYRLAADRSQTGHLPFFAVETRVNLWQSIVPYVRDVDRDGQADLVLAYWKGLTDSRIVLDAYLADGDGSFRSNPGTTGFDVKRGERSFVAWEHDVTGNGVTDLLVLGRGRLQVHEGDPAALATGRGRDLVAAKPAHEVLVVANAEGDEEVEVGVALGGGGMQLSGERLASGRVQLVDLDGDGVFEALFGVPDGARWKLSFVRFTASDGATSDG